LNLVAIDDLNSRQAWGEKVMKDKSAHAGVARRAPFCPASMGRVVGKFCFILSSFILRWQLHDDSQHEARCFMLVVNMRLVTGMIVKKRRVQRANHFTLWIGLHDLDLSGRFFVIWRTSGWLGKINDMKGL